MSLNLLLLDEKKPWLNARVNDLTIDGDLTIRGSDIDNPETRQGTAQGTFIITPFEVDYSLIKIGNYIAIRIGELAVSNGNQNASGNIDFMMNLSADEAPNFTYSGVIPIISPDGTIVVTRFRLFSTGKLEIYATPQTRAFTKSTSIVATEGPLQISYLRV